MRVTLTLADDAAALLKHVLTRRPNGLRAVVNEGLRHGPREIDAASERREAYRTPSVETGRCLPPRQGGSAAAVSLPATTGTISNSIRCDQPATQRCSSVTSSHSMS
jgi:hypothetical protein